MQEIADILQAQGSLKTRDGKPSSTRVTGARKHLAGVLGVLFILALWQLAAFALPDFLMPGVPAVVQRLFEDLGKQSFHQSLLGTLGRLGAGYGLAPAQRHRHPAVDSVDRLGAAVPDRDGLRQYAHHRRGCVVGVLSGRAQRDERHRIRAARARVGGARHGRHALGPGQTRLSAGRDARIDHGRATGVRQCVARADLGRNADRLRQGPGPVAGLFG
ncbi:hypothetical protein G6F22_017213 [Rhizopus arrhizus]|nr:hypothetical protein G6F22_017213 [Rhizopus arrhizus]